jgi:hypothetical protein
MRGSLPISLLAATVLTGCASVAIDEDFAEVERFARCLLYHISEPTRH